MFFRIFRTNSLFQLDAYSENRKNVYEYYSLFPTGIIPVRGFFKFSIIEQSPTYTGLSTEFLSKLSIQSCMCVLIRI